MYIVYRGMYSVMILIILLSFITQHKCHITSFYVFNCRDCAHHTADHQWTIHLPTNISFSFIYREHWYHPALHVVV